MTQALSLPEKEDSWQQPLRGRNAVNLWTRLRDMTSERFVLLMTSLRIADFIFQIQKVPPQIRRVKRTQLIPVCQNPFKQIVLTVGLPLQVCLALLRLRVHSGFCFFSPTGSDNLAAWPNRCLSNGRASICLLRLTCIANFHSGASTHPMPWSRRLRPKWGGAPAAWCQTEP